MNLVERYGNTALIAGASEGIGAAFATLLAAEGTDLILVARRQEPLQRLSEELAGRYGVKISHIICDLSDECAADKIISSLGSTEPDILIYNAALSYIGPFVDQPAEGHVQAARVNMITPLEMVHYFGKRMISRGRGAIVLMSSLAGFQGSGNLATYAATKAFTRILAESLWYEWKDKGVDIIACCAGATATPGYFNSLPGKTSLFAPGVQKPEDVARKCLAELGNKPSVISGRGNRLVTFLMQRMLPRKTIVEIMGDNIKKLYGM